MYLQIPLVYHTRCYKTHQEKPTKVTRTEGYGSKEFVLLTGIVKMGPLVSVSILLCIFTYTKYCYNKFLLKHLFEFPHESLCTLIYMYFLK